MKNQLPGRAKNSRAASPTQPATAVRKNGVHPASAGPGRAVRTAPAESELDRFKREYAAEPLPHFGRWPIESLGTATMTVFAGLDAPTAAGFMALAFVRHRAFFRKIHGSLVAEGEDRLAAELMEAWMLADAIVDRRVLCRLTPSDMQDADADFVLPLPGLAGFTRRVWREAATQLAFVLYYDHAEATLRYRSKVASYHERAALAEAVLVAEAVLHAEGHATPLGDRKPNGPRTMAEKAARKEMALLGAHV